MSSDITLGSADNDDVFQLPPWRQGFVEFHRAGFQYGQEIPKEWFLKAMRIQWPQVEELYQSDCFPTMSQLMAFRQREQQAELVFVKQFASLRQAISDDLLMELESLPGFGYKVMLPKEQHIKVYEKRQKNIAKEIREMCRGIRNVNTSLLTNQERQEHADILTKAAMIATLNRKARRTPLLRDGIG